MKKFFPLKKRLKKRSGSRGARLAVNLLLTAVGITLLWRALGCPLGSMEREFHRMERTHLMEPSEIVLATGKTGVLRTADGTRLRLKYSKIVAVQGERVAMADMDRDHVWTFPLEDGPTPVPLYTAPIYHVSVPGTVIGGVPLVFLRVPEETARAELEVRAKEEVRRWSGTGADLGWGRWIFDTSHSGNHQSQQQDEKYILRLYDEAGGLLLEKRGAVPPK